MALSLWPPRRRRIRNGWSWKRRFSFRKLRTTILLCASLLAVFPPLFFHLRLRRFHQILARRCDWLRRPPLVCAHGGDSSLALPNTVNTPPPSLLSLLSSLFSVLSLSFSAPSSLLLSLQMDAFHYAIRSHVDCIEVDVSRSSDGVLFALHRRFLSSSSSCSSSILASRLFLILFSQSGTCNSLLVTLLFKLDI